MNGIRFQTYHKNSRFLCKQSLHVKNKVEENQGRKIGLSMAIPASMMAIGTNGFSMTR